MTTGFVMALIEGDQDVETLTISVDGDQLTLGHYGAVATCNLAEFWEQLLAVRLAEQKKVEEAA